MKQREFYKVFRSFTEVDLEMTTTIILFLSHDFFLAQNKSAALAHFTHIF